ncbi:MAG: FAE1/Type III polyketide synthase-like protein-domain-containing protein [Monoraphidium minutum]|nr:MAG: FAE1/Type III polyketide synthase-like protein-domain-containing protein [Monoraphidium minutum]
MAQQEGNGSIRSMKKALNSLCRNAGMALAVPAVAVLACRLSEMHSAGELEQLLQRYATTDVNISTMAVLAGVVLLVAAIYRLLFPAERPTYLVDFAVHKGLEEWKFPKEWFLPHSTRVGKGKFTEDDLQFQEKILMRSGLGDETYIPPWLYSQPPHYDMAHARKEFEICCFSAVTDLLNKTGVSPKQVGIVITNCSLFNPTPSLSATIMHHFGMSSSTINYNLGGMGCSAGVVAIDLARQMLQIYPNSYALVVSHENLTSNWYPGSDRSMLVPNCIFRSNGAAILLSNKTSESWRAKYHLQTLVRTIIAADDEAFQCVYQMEDASGVRGVRLAKELMAVAGRTLKQNMTTLGPHVLPLSEKLLFAANFVARTVLGAKKVAPYVPDFTEAFEHICIHTGGRAVLDTMEKAMRLPAEYMEPSRAGLYRFGNVSSTSVWYVLAFIESYRGVRRGEKVWQLGFGSGFKCNSAVWVARRRNAAMHPAWDKFDLQAMRDEFEEAEKEKAAYLAAKAAGKAN